MLIWSWSCCIFPTNRSCGAPSPLTSGPDCNVAQRDRISTTPVAHDAIQLGNHRILQGRTGFLKRICEFVQLAAGGRRKVAVVACQPPGDTARGEAGDHRVCVGTCADEIRDSGPFAQTREEVEAVHADVLARILGEQALKLDARDLVKAAEKNITSLA